MSDFLHLGSQPTFEDDFLNRVPSKCIFSLNSSSDCRDYLDLRDMTEELSQFQSAMNHSSKSNRFRVDPVVEPEHTYPKPLDDTVPTEFGNSYNFDEAIEFNGDHWYASKKLLNSPKAFQLDGRNELAFDGHENEYNFSSIIPDALSKKDRENQHQYQTPDKYQYQKRHQKQNQNQNENQNQHQYQYQYEDQLQLQFQQRQQDKRCGIYFLPASNAEESPSETEQDEEPRYPHCSELQQKAQEIRKLLHHELEREPYASQEHLQEQELHEKLVEHQRKLQKRISLQHRKDFPRQKQEDVECFQDEDLGHEKKNLLLSVPLPSPPPSPSPLTLPSPSPSFSQQSQCEKHLLVQDFQGEYYLQPRECLEQQSEQLLGDARKEDQSKSGNVLKKRVSFRMNNEELLSQNSETERNTEGTKKSSNWSFSTNSQNWQNAEALRDAFTQIFGAQSHLTKMLDSIDSVKTVKTVKSVKTVKKPVIPTETNSTDDDERQYLAADECVCKGKIICAPQKFTKFNTNITVKSCECPRLTSSHSAPNAGLAVTDEVCASLAKIQQELEAIKAHFVERFTRHLDKDMKDKVLLQNNIIANCKAVDKLLGRCRCFEVMRHYEMRKVEKDIGELRKAVEDALKGDDSCLQYVFKYFPVFGIVFLFGLAYYNYQCKN